MPSKSNADRAVNAVSSQWSLSHEDRHKDDLSMVIGPLSNARNSISVLGHIRSHRQYSLGGFLRLLSTDSIQVAECLIAN